jgi:hypothetical protein
VKEEEISNVALAGTGFPLDQPVVGKNAPPRPKVILRGESSDDLLYIVRAIRDRLFLWDLNWAGCSPAPEFPRAIICGPIASTDRLKTRQSTRFAAIVMPGWDAGAEYYCELGSFVGVEWKCLVRSATTATPEASMSADFSAEFASLPTHLSFQRLVDIFAASRPDRATLARSVAELQENARRLKIEWAPGDLSQLVTELAGQLNGANGSATSGPDTGDLPSLSSGLYRRRPTRPLRRWPDGRISRPAWWIKLDRRQPQRLRRDSSA